MIEHEEYDSLENFELQMIILIHASQNFKFHQPNVIKPGQLSTTVAPVVPMVKSNFVDLKFSWQSAGLLLHDWPGPEGQHFNFK